MELTISEVANDALDRFQFGDASRPTLRTVLNAVEHHIRCYLYPPYLLGSFGSLLDWVCDPNYEPHELKGCALFRLQHEIEQSHWLLGHYEFQEQFLNALYIKDSLFRYRTDETWIEPGFVTRIVWCSKSIIDELLETVMRKARNKILVFRIGVELLHELNASTEEVHEFVHYHHKKLDLRLKRLDVVFKTISRPLCLQLGLPVEDFCGDGHFELPRYSRSRQAFIFHHRKRDWTLSRALDFHVSELKYLREGFLQAIGDVSNGLPSYLDFQPDNTHCILPVDVFKWLFMLTQLKRGDDGFYMYRGNYVHVYKTFRELSVCPKLTQVSSDGDNPFPCLPLPRFRLIGQKKRRRRSRSSGTIIDQFGVVFPEWFRVTTRDERMAGIDADLQNAFPELAFPDLRITSWPTQLPW